MAHEQVNQKVKVGVQKENTTYTQWTKIKASMQKKNAMLPPTATITIEGDKELFDDLMAQLRWLNWIVKVIE
jgi:multidrug efflux pump subunit AcrB